MKMGDRRLKYLDRLGNRVMHKTKLSGRPSNRAERRAFEAVLRQEKVSPGEINEDALFAELAKRRKP